MIGKRVDLKIRFACNNMCKFCVQGDKRLRFADKDMPKITKELAEGYRAGCRSVVFTGGEPSLHPKIINIVRQARKIGYTGVQIQTNGRFFCYEDFCRKIVAAGITEFSPALQSSNAKLHDFLTDSPGSFVQTVRSIQNMKALGVPIITNSVITKPNFRNLPELASLFVSLGVNQFQFAFVHILGSAAKNKSWIVPRKSMIEPWVKEGLDIGLNAGLKVMTEAIPYCFMSGYEKYVAEEVIPETIIFDADFKVDRFSHYRKTEGKIRGPLCKRCSYGDVCEGPWKEYPEMFGWGEFKPVK